MLASQYGWSKRDIYENVYLDEAVSYAQIIANRKRDEYRIQLAIAQNPHTESPQELWNAFGSSMGESSSVPESSALYQKDLDKDGFSRLAQAMRGNPRIKVNC